MSVTAENYQLKWHSHLTNLNSSVATLFRSEKYADVLLFASNSDINNSLGIPAHKLILSSCSHYFASIFDGSPTPPNTLVYVILPPELSKRSIQILIQYMYSGEATVSNDILNEVLRGGEVLKIRGLWRNHQTNNNESNNVTNNNLTSCNNYRSTTASQYPQAAAAAAAATASTTAATTAVTVATTTAIAATTNANATTIQLPPPSKVIVETNNKENQISVLEKSILEHNTSNIQDRFSPNQSHQHQQQHHHQHHQHHQQHQNHPQHQPHHHHHHHHQGTAVIRESPVITLSTTKQSSHLPSPLQQQQQPPSNHFIAENDRDNFDNDNNEIPPLTAISSSRTSPTSPLSRRNSSINQLKDINRELCHRNDDSSTIIPPSHYGLVSLQIAAETVKKAQQNNVLLEEKQLQRKSLSQMDNNLTINNDLPTIKLIKNYNNDSPQQLVQQPLVESRHPDKYRVDSVVTSGSRQQHLHSTSAETVRYLSNSDKNDFKISDELFTIKQEPTEWCSEYDGDDDDGGGGDGGRSGGSGGSRGGSRGDDANGRNGGNRRNSVGIAGDNQNNGNGTKPEIEVTIKPEIFDDEDEDEAHESENESMEHDEMVYSPLTCELCSETFTVPAAWVRHIEGHSETTQCIPKKRKRVDESVTENLAELRCDLCSMYFVTPADWVRHVQNTHTETELALSNNSSPPKRNQRPARPVDGQPLEKSCSVCRKTFPSYASMIIHKRTHTGERPFYCSLCDKGFNVKSNLLRHMRTLHNQLLNPSNLNDYPSDDGIQPE